MVLDNLREGVLSPDFYDPGVNPLYRDVLAHYGVTALPCKVRDPDRKGKVESGVAHAQKTPLKGKKFESLEEAQAYLDHWEENWADKRIHGRTKRQVAAMFAEEKPHLQPLPLEPFRYYQYGERTVHLDGCDSVSRPNPTTHPLRGTPIMNLIELNRSLVQLRLSGMAAVLETRLLQAQSEAMAPIDLISILVSDELACRGKRLLERRHKQAQFRDPNKQLDNFDFQFNPKMNRSLVFDLATAAWIGRREDALFLGPAGSGKSHCAQAIAHAVIQQGYRVLYREAHILLEELADATLDGNRKQHVELLTTVPLLIIDDLGMRKLGEPPPRLRVALARAGSSTSWSSP